MIVSKGTRIYIVYTKVFPWSNAYVDCSITRQAVSSVWSNTNSRLNSHHHLLLAASEQRYAFILYRFLTKLYDLGPIRKKFYMKTWKTTVRGENQSFFG